MVKALAAQDIKVVADISTDPGQVDFSGPALKIKQSDADALFAYLTEEEGARLLRELKKQGFDKPIIGETTIIGQKVIELAGPAAEGILGHVGLTPDAPQAAVKAFDEKYLKEYKQRSDHNGMKGYSAVYIIKAMTERVGKFDSKARPLPCMARKSQPRTIPASCSTSALIRRAISIAKALSSRSLAASSKSSRRSRLSVQSRRGLTTAARAS